MDAELKIKVVQRLAGRLVMLYRIIWLNAHIIHVIYTGLMAAGDGQLDGFEAIPFRIIHRVVCRLEGYVLLVKCCFEYVFLPIVGKGDRTRYLL